MLLFAQFHFLQCHQYIHITFVPQELFIHRRHIIMATLGTIMTIFITLTLCALKLSLPTYCTVWYSQRYTLSLLHIIRPYLRCLLQVLLVWDIILILLIRSIGRCPPLIVSHIRPLCPEKKKTQKRNQKSTKVTSLLSRYLGYTATYLYGWTRRLSQALSATFFLCPLRHSTYVLRSNLRRCIFLHVYRLTAGSTV